MSKRITVNEEENGLNVTHFGLKWLMLVTPKSLHESILYLCGFVVRVSVNRTMEGFCERIFSKMRND